jgi:hypothetical protein
MSNKMRVCFGPKTLVVAENALTDCQMPPATDSYQPLPHIQFLGMVQDALALRGVQIKEAVHAIWRGGQRYFGLMEITHPSISNPEMSLALGLRNSTDKSLPATIAAGSSVFVCDNLCIASEMVIGRKHTKNMFDNLSARIEIALKVIETYWADHFRRVQTYKGFDVGNLQAHDLIIQAYRDGAISKTGIADVVDQWYHPNHPEFKDRNLWSLHSAFTEAFKGRADLLAERSGAMHSLFDRAAGFKATNLREHFAEDAAVMEAIGSRSAGKGARSTAFGA